MIPGGSVNIDSQKIYDSFLDKIYAPDITDVTDFIGVRKEMDGTKKLILAVLCEAIRVYTSPLSLNKESINAANEARRWIFSNDRSYIFSFCSICDILGLSTGYVRKKVNNLKKKQTLLLKLNKKRRVEIRIGRVVKFSKRAA